MNYIPPDTHPEAMRVWYEALKRLGPAGRVKMALEAGDNLRLNIECGIRSRQPELDDAGVRREIVRVLLGPELYQSVIGKIKA